MSQIQSFSDSNAKSSSAQSTQNNLKVLGFDIGIASIGWAYVEGGELKDCGVRIFTKAENPKDGSSLALPRREARGARRRLARRKGRLYALKDLICKEFGLNLGDFLASAGELPRAYYTDKSTKSPYELRTEALKRKLTSTEFARVILHIAKHRGYGNKHAKESSDEKDKKKKSEQDGIKGGIAKNKGYKENYETIGAYLYKEFYGKARSAEQIQAKIEALKADYKKEKIKPEKWDKNKLEKQSPNQQNNVRNKLKNYERCLKQDWLKEELEIIFAKQREFGFEFKGDKYKIYDENRKIMKDEDGKIKELDFESAVLQTAFLQRPLKSFADKVGLCTFFGDEKGGFAKRAPKDSLSATEFRALTRIINTLANISKRSGEVYSAEQVREILNIVLDKGEMTYKNLRKIIALDEKMQFPKDSKLDYSKGEDAEKAKLIEFSKLKAFKKALGGSFDGFSRNELDSIATDIALIKSKDSLKQTLSANYPRLNEAQREALSELNFDKFIDLSFKALEAILPFMRGESLKFKDECKRYDEAWREAGLVEVAKKTQKGDKLPPLIEYEPNLANPVVARALSEYRKVCNALLAKYGAVHKIHLEFTREAGVSAKERGQIIAEQNKRFKANEEARKRCAEYGLSLSGINMLKLKLWQEQNEFCVYSGRKITREDLANPNALQIDHIYPYSRSYDDSQNNKVLCFTSENQHKLNKTPFEAFGSDSAKWNAILGLIQKLPKPKKSRITNKNFADKEGGFIARNIVDTSYIATLTASYTDAFIEFLPLVENENTTLGRGQKGSKKHITVVNGSLTATMRHYWGLNTLLDSQSANEKKAPSLAEGVGGGSLRASEASVAIQEKNIDCHAKSSDFARNDSICHTEGVHSTTEVSQNDNRDILPTAQYDNDLDSSVALPPQNDNIVAKNDKKISEGKDRSNHLHHALDAIIIAYTNDSIIKAFSDFKKTQEQNKARLIAKEIESSEYKISRRFFSPSHFANNEAFRQSIKRKILGEVSESNEQVSGIFVSKPPRKRARGALHKETFSSLDSSDLLETYGGKGNPKEIQKQGVERAIKLGKIRQIGSKVADNGAMVRVDIFRHKLSGKFYGVPIYTMDFALGTLPNKAVVGGKDKSGVIKEWLEMDSSYKFCFSLFKDDLILVQKKEMKNAELCYFVSFGIATASISVEKHDNHFGSLTQNQKLLFTNATPQEVKGLSIGIQNLKVFEKWQVSPLGEVQKAEYKEREDIKLKSSPKDFNNAK
ncbi:type II CRISPR RNA-guided endonuclease Cas9 [Helicobacter sp. T3_23-1059]